MKSALLLAGLLCATSCACSASAATPFAADIRARIAALPTQLTTEEKAVPHVSSYPSGMVPCYSNGPVPSGPQYSFEGPFGVTFQYGRGLSYAAFKFGPTRLSTPTMPPGSSTQLNFSVTNTGNRAGNEVLHGGPDSVTGQDIRHIVR